MIKVMHSVSDISDYDRYFDNDRTNFVSLLYLVKYIRCVSA